MPPPNPPLAYPVFPAGFGPLHTDFDNWITTPFLFARAGIVFRARLLGGQAITGATATVIAFDTIDEDPYGGWSSTSTGTQAANSWQPPFDGVYSVVTSLVNGAATEAIIAAGMGITGAGFVAYNSKSGSSALACGASGERKFALAGGADYVQGMCWGASAFNIATGTSDPSKVTSMDIYLVSL